ncbi:MAG TPA: DNA polymerase domain-containing protein [Firmicutes bacterium]|jgi:bifunctional non-homologous end joining protein LigD|nr:DNA polymerase domain-containing protein [Bacillota bacterium]
MILQTGFKNSLKNLNKIFWPDEGYTKGDLMHYYSGIWPLIKPYLEGRPVSLVRYPEGITGNFFYQKDVPEPPAWVETLPIVNRDRIIHYAMINNPETLIWSVNLGCIEVHPWLSTRSTLDYPSYVIFDLDPMEPAVFSDAVQIALSIHAILNELHLKSFPKISGATGIHIYVPIQNCYRFEQTSDFVKKIGAIIIQAFPEKATNERKVSQRSGKVYIDHLQNIRGKTIAAVYSVRPLPGAPVSTPVSWEELPDCHPAMFSIESLLKRTEKVGDLFYPLLSMKQELPKI